MTLNLKHRTEIIKTNIQRNRNINRQNKEKPKLRLTKRTGTEQNHDHTEIMQKIHFRSSFNFSPFKRNFFPNKP